MAPIILEKRFFRSDRIWTLKWFYQIIFLRRIPFYLDTKALLTSQFWNRSRIERYQDRRIACILRAAGRLPMWQKRFSVHGINLNASLSRKTLEQLPILTKRDFIAVEESAYVDQKLQKRSLQDQTSGSTGRPFTFYHNLGYVLRSFAIVERMLRTAGNGTRYSLIVVRRAERMGFSFLLTDFFYLESYGSLKYRLDELLALMRRRERVILFLWGSVSVEFARLLKERGIHPDIGGLIVTGEAITEQDRRDIESATGSRITVSYAGSDVGRIAFECPQKRLHINEESVYLEIVDEQGRLVADGTAGRIVATSFDNDVMPFIRYDTGDRGIISSDPCPCGRSLRTLKLSGRQIHLLHFPDGRTVSVLDIKARFDRLSKVIEEYQIVRTGPYAFTIRAIAGPEFEAKKDTVAEETARFIHPESKVSWELVAKIDPLPSGKAAYFVDKTRSHA